MEILRTENLCKTYGSGENAVHADTRGARTIQAMRAMQAPRPHPADPRKLIRRPGHKPKRPDREVIWKLSGGKNLSGVNPDAV